MGLSSLTALPSRGAFTASELVPVASAPPARTYVAGIARAPLSEHARVKTDGTNILIRQLSQSRARAEAKKRAQRAQAAAEAKRRGIGEGGMNCRREDKCEGDTGADHGSMRLYCSKSRVGFLCAFVQEKEWLGYEENVCKIRLPVERICAEGLLHSP